MEERVVDQRFDPLVWLGNKIGLIKRGAGQQGQRRGHRALTASSA
jgi:hypothetical protein